MKIRILRNTSCSDHSVYRREFFSIALEHFKNDLISKNPVCIYHSGSNWLQETKVVEMIAVGEGKNISLRIQ